MRQNSTFAATRGLCTVAVFLVLATLATAENWKLRKVHNFHAHPSAFPAGALITDGADNLYGTTAGGAGGYGSVFELEPSTKKSGYWNMHTLHNFRRGHGNGSGAEGAVVFDSAGNLYGTTFYGGKSDSGTIFKLTPPKEKGGRWKETTLYEFDGCNNGCGGGGLILGPNGTLYGTTVYGGTYGNGTVYQLTLRAARDRSILTVLHNFVGGTSDGEEPLYDGGNLVMDDQGSLYGETVFGGAHNAGIVFRMTLSENHESWTEDILYTFTGGNDGGGPDGGLIFDVSGNLYGVTHGGGTSQGGTVFELRPAQGDSWTETVLCSFSGGGEDGLWGRLVFDSVGNLYGTTLRGGPHKAGTVFQLKPENQSWTETTLHNFTGLKDGGLPYAGLTIGNDGALYGTANAGGDLKTCEGSRGCGTVFKVYDTK